MNRSFALLVFMTWVASGSVPADNGAPSLAKGDWPVYGGDNRSAKYSLLEQIDASDVYRFKILWRWESIRKHTLDEHKQLRPGEFQGTPIKNGRNLFTSAAMSQAAALDAATGEPLWSFDPETWRVGLPTTKGFMHRGVASWSNGTDERVILATGDSRLIALDANTGKKIRIFGVGGEINTKLIGMRRPVEGPNDCYGRTSRALVCRDVIVIAAGVRRWRHEPMALAME